MAAQAPSIKDLSDKATDAEKNKDNSHAIQLYKEIIMMEPLYEHAYDRLMKIYRSMKDYKNSLSIINAGIKAYDKFYNTHAKKTSKKISELSAKLNKSFGLVNKKGIAAYSPDPLGRWKKRKETVNKKLKS